MNSKLLGAILIVAGTVIGAGMLFTPFKTAELGFNVTVVALLAFLFLLIVPALAIAELGQFAPVGTPLGGLVKLGLGRTGEIVNDVLFFVFIYAIICAYDNGIGNIIAGTLGFSGTNAQIVQIVVGVVLSVVVLISSHLSSIFNQIFFYLMLAAFAILVVVALPYIQLHNLAALPVSREAVFTAVPVFFLLFGFHTIIPSLNEFLNHNIKQLKIALVVGLLIPFALYTIWMFVIDGVSEQSGLIAFSKGSNVSVGSLLGKYSNSNILNIAIDVFSISALVTSFIGVSLAQISALHNIFKQRSVRKVAKKVKLTDKIKELSDEVVSYVEEDTEPKVDNSTQPVVSSANRGLIFVIGFLPCIIISTYFPSVFVLALQFAAIIFALQALVMPLIALAIIRVKNKNLYTDKTVYRLKLPTVILVVLALVYFYLSILN